MTSSLTPTILFEDPHVIVLSKPPGLLSQGARHGEPNLVDWLRKYLGRHYVGLVHRLDRNVSGVMVVAKRSKAARRLTLALHDGRIERTYLAWLQGNLDTVRRWKHWLVKDEKENKTRVFCDRDLKNFKPPPRQAKEALLLIRPVAYGKKLKKTVTLAECRLKTGRSHQIRAQASYEGFPVLGDGKYGAPHFHTITRPLLHSRQISFPAPVSGKTMKFEAPLPADMKIIKVDQWLDHGFRGGF